MRKASNIILLVSAIASIAVAVTFLILGIVFINLGGEGSREWIIEQLKNGTVTTSYEGTPEEQAEFMQLMLSIYGVVFFVFVPFQAANSVISFIGRKKETKALYILNIVFGVISAVEINIVGGVFGLIAENREQNLKAQAE